MYGSVGCKIVCFIFAEACTAVECGIEWYRLCCKACEVMAEAEETVGLAGITGGGVTMLCSKGVNIFSCFLSFPFLGSFTTKEWKPTQLLFNERDVSGAMGNDRRQVQATDGRYHSRWEGTGEKETTKKE